MPNMAEILAARAVADQTPGAIETARLYPEVPGTSGPAGLAEHENDRYVGVRLVGRAATYYVRAGLTDSGPVVLGLFIAPDEGEVITSADLRRIPVQRLAAIASRIHVNPRDDAAPEIELPELDHAMLMTTPERKPRQGRGRKPRTTAELQEVAKLVSEARKHHESARQAVADHLGRSPATADKVIRQAREAGFLKPMKPPPPRPEGTDE